MTKNVRLQDFLSLEFILLFFCSVEFLSKFYSLIILLFLVVWLRGYFKVSSIASKNFLYITLFILSYWLFAYKDIPILIVPVWLLSYVIGFCLSDNTNRFFRMWLLIAFGIALHSFLIFVTNINKFGVDAMGNRIMQDIWGGELMRGATALACSFLLGSAMIIPFFLRQKNKFWPIVFSIFILFGAFFNSVSTASRSALIYPTIIIAVSYFTLIERKNRIKYISLAVLIVCVVVVLYLGNAFGIRSFFEDQYLFERISEKEGGGIIENQRLELWNDFFAHIDKYVLGGGSFGDTGDRDYVHNIIFDTFAVGGVVPALFLTLLIISFIRVAFRLHKRSEDKSFKTMIIGLMFGFLLIFMTEPIIQAANWFFSFFLMLVGGLDRINYQQRIGAWE